MHYTWLLCLLGAVYNNIIFHLSVHTFQRKSNVAANALSRGNIPLFLQTQPSNLQAVLPSNVQTLIPSEKG